MVRNHPIIKVVTFFLVLLFVSWAGAWTHEDYSSAMERAERLSLKGEHRSALDLLEQMEHQYQASFARWNILLLRGNIHYKIGEYEKALHCYDRVIQLSPKIYIGYYNKGAALYGLGRYEEALREFKKALCLRQDDSDVKQAIELTLRKLATGK